MKKAVHGFTHTEDAYGISSYVLDANGLEVLVAPRHDFPVIGTMVTYHVGSRHELPGHTGATHILEHVMFKGSKKFDPKNGKGIWQMLEKKGAQGNATTWCDRTNYYWITPNALFEDTLTIEADRMRNILLRPEDLASEMTVVRNEYESGENNPYQRLSKQAWYEAFTLHPYRIPTIGTKEDIESVSVEKLRAFYDTFYWPNNATVTIVGDVEIPEALERVSAAFSVVPQHTIEIPPFSREPEQSEERRFKMKRKGTVNAVLFCFKAPAGLEDSSFSLAVLSALLAEGKSSILHKSLVDAGLAIDIDIALHRFKDPSILEMYISLPDGVAHEKIESVVLEAIDRIIERGVRSDELERAKNFAVSRKRYGMSSVAGTLSALNEAIARGDWKDAYQRTERMKAVTASDVQKTAARYLVRSQLTLGFLHAL